MSLHAASVSPKLAPQHSMCRMMGTARPVCRHGVPGLYCKLTGCQDVPQLICFDINIHRLITVATASNNHYKQQPFQASPSHHVVLADIEFYVDCFSKFGFQNASTLGCKQMTFVCYVAGVV